MNGCEYDPCCPTLLTKFLKWIFSVFFRLCCETRPTPCTPPWTDASTSSRTPSSSRRRGETQSARPSCGHLEPAFPTDRRTSSSPRRITEATCSLSKAEAAANWCQRHKTFCFFVADTEANIDCPSLESFSSLV